MKFFASAQFCPFDSYLQVPANTRLVAVPLYELYDNMARYGPVMSAIPSLLSRYRFVGAQQPSMGPPLTAQQQLKEQQQREQQQPKLQRVQ